MNDYTDMRRNTTTKPATNAPSANSPGDIGIRSGTFRITEFHPIPTPRPMYGSLESDLIQAWDAQSGQVSTLLRFTYKENEEYSSESTQVLTLREIQDIINAIEFITVQKPQILAGCRTYTEVRYQTESDFAVGLFASPDGASGEYCVVDGESVFLRSIDNILATLLKFQEKSQEAIANWRPC